MFVSGFVCFSGGAFAHDIAGSHYSDSTASGHMRNYLRSAAGSSPITFDFTTASDTVEIGSATLGDLTALAIYEEISLTTSQANVKLDIALTATDSVTFSNAAGSTSFSITDFASIFASSGLNNGMLEVYGNLNLNANSRVMDVNRIIAHGDVYINSTSPFKVTFFDDVSIGGNINIQTGILELYEEGAQGNTPLINISSGATLLIENDTQDFVEYSGALSGEGTISVTSGASLNLSGSSSVNTFEGTVSVSGSGSFLEFLNSAYGSTHTLSIGSGATCTFNTSDEVIGGSTSGSGTIEILAGTGKTLYFEGDKSSFTGTILLERGTLAFNYHGSADYNASFTGSGNLENADTGTVTLKGDLSGLTTGTTTISDGTLSLTTTNFPASTHSISIALGKTLNLQPSGSASFGGIISDAGTVTKTGASTMTLTGINTYTGGTNITEGTLALSGNGTLAAKGVVTATGILDINAVTTTATIGDLAGAGSVVLGSKALTLGTASDSSFTGVISGSGGTLTKQGVGTLTLSGTNTYTGLTTISAGTLALSGGGTVIPVTNDVVANGSFSISGVTTGATIGDLSGTGATASVVLGSKTLTLGTTSSSSFAGVISGTGALTKQGSGTLTLTGANTYSGATTISAGTLALSGSGALKSTNDVVANGTFSISGVTTSSTIGDLSGSGTVAIGAKTLTLGTSSNSSYSGKITGTGNITKNGTGQLTLSGDLSGLSGGTTTISNGVLSLTTAIYPADGHSFSIGLDKVLNLEPSGTAICGNVISGEGYIIKKGAAKLILAGANTFEGPCEIDAGTLSLSGSGSIASASQVVALGTLDISSLATGTTIKGLFGSGDVTLGSKTLTIEDLRTSPTFSGTIAGAGTLIKQGTGTQTLTGVNTYTGATLISAGKLALSGSGALAAIGAVISTGTFDISAVTTGATIGDLSGSGAVTLGSKTLTLGTTSTSEFSGTVTGTGGAITKQGTGTLTLSSSGNFYSGATSITAGTLKYQNTPTLLTSGVAISAGATAEFGTGILTYANAISGAGAITKSGSSILSLSGDSSTTYTGDIAVSEGTLHLTSTGKLSKASTTTTVASGANLKGNGYLYHVVNNGTLQPGASIGTLHILGNYTQANGSSLEIEFDHNGNTDLVAVTGTTTIASGATLVLQPQLPSGFVNGQTFTFLTSGGGFTDATQFSTVTIDNPSRLSGFEIAYTYGANAISFTLTGINPFIDNNSFMMSLNSDLAKRLIDLKDNDFKNHLNISLLEKNPCCEIAKKFNRKGAVIGYTDFAYKRGELKPTTNNIDGDYVLYSPMIGIDFLPTSWMLIGFGFNPIFGDIKATRHRGKISTESYGGSLYTQIYPLKNLFASLTINDIRKPTNLLVG
jgi:fibronectin-binding autotransporter adhesin